MATEKQVRRVIREVLREMRVNEAEEGYDGDMNKTITLPHDINLIVMPIDASPLPKDIVDDIKEDFPPGDHNFVQVLFRGEEVGNGLLVDWGDGDDDELKALIARVTYSEVPSHEQVEEDVQVWVDSDPREF